MNRSQNNMCGVVLSPGQSVELVVERPAAGGAMIARVDRQIVLVTGAIPGERVKARIERVSKHVAFASTAAVDEPSADRREAFSDPLCGGCTYSHIAYARQLAIKSDVIADAFTRIGRIVLPAPVRVAGSAEEGYRMRARLHVRNRRVGFFREGTHEICDARISRQLLPATCDVIDRVTAVVRSLGSDAIREIELSENVDASERVVHVDATQPLDARALDAMSTLEGLTPGPHVSDRITIDGRPFTLRRHVLAFFQGNRYLLSDLVSHVSARVPLGSAVIDLYAGVGLFAVAAAALRGASVVAVEGDRVAAADLHANASAAGGQLTSVRADVEGFLRGLGGWRGAGVPRQAWDALSLSKGAAQPLEVLIVDPPRTGLSREALDGILQVRPPRLVYVSCDVATLARDARRIIDTGYTIDRIDAFDLFPNTPHVETVTVFDRDRT